jgi:hypothetical protein
MGIESVSGGSDGDHGGRLVVVVAGMHGRMRRPEADAMLLIVDRMLTFCGHYWSKLGHLRLPFAFALFPSHVVSFISYMLL